MFATDTRWTTRMTDENPDNPKSGLEFTPLDASGLVTGFVIGWLLFGSLLWGLIFALVMGAAFSTGSRIAKR